MLEKGNCSLLMTQTWILQTRWHALQWYWKLLAMWCQLQTMQKGYIMAPQQPADAAISSRRTCHPAIEVLLELT